MNKKIRVIARGSRLSRLQVEEVFRQFPELPYEIKYLESYGDKHQQISLLNGEAPADIFTRELDDAIRNGDADIAIHSAKDLPYPLPEDLEVIALFPAFDTTDSLVSREHKTLAELPAGSVIGTSSPLRKKGLKELRPDLTIKGIRGCIEERVQQVKDGKYDAVIVATCALKRLGIEAEIAEVLPFATHPLQGFLAITAKKEETTSSEKERASSEKETISSEKKDNKDYSETYSIAELKAAFAEKSILQKQGTVSLVGFGPGDPDLLTIKAAKSIEQADIIFYDDLIDPSYLEDKKAEKVYVGKRAGYHHKEQGDINRLLLDAARAGKQVVRLKGGDPMIFAHGSEEIEYLESNLIHVNVIPGITTASALAASQKISLTHRDFSSSVALVSGHTQHPVTPNAETLVYYMGAKQLQAIATQLIDEGWAMNTSVLLTYNVSRPDEQTFETTLWELRNGTSLRIKTHNHILETSDKENSVESIALADLPTPLIALIGYVADLKHHQASSIKPTLYTGTLPPLEKRKPDYTYTPLIEINYHPTYFSLFNEFREYTEEEEEKDTLHLCKAYYGKKTMDYIDENFMYIYPNFGESTHLLFTSQYSVAPTIKAMKEYFRNYEEEKKKRKFISIGNTTTKALHDAGIADVIQVDIDNRYGVIEWFKKERESFLSNQKAKYNEIKKRLEELPWNEVSFFRNKEEMFIRQYENPCVYFPHSSLTPEFIPKSLQELGYSVASIVAYNNVMPQQPRRVNINHFKRIVFTSPSTIDNFIQLYGKLPEDTEFITRGPITQEHLEEVMGVKKEE